MRGADGFSVDEGDIVLLQYGYDKYYFAEEEGRLENFYGSNAPGLTEAANQYLLDKKIRAIAPIPVPAKSRRGRQVYRYRQKRSRNLLPSEQHPHYGKFL
jgi:hypothetical protein